MSILILFAFIAGVVTILSPCILPVLPIVLSGATVEGKRYPLGIVVAFVLSFSFFTLFLTALVNATGVSADLVRYVAMAIIFVFGLVLVVPQLKNRYQMFVSRIGAGASGSGRDKSGFWSGFLVGISLGLVWTPCVGPILASVIALAVTGSVTGTAVLITLAYALGTAIPMFAVMYGGRSLLQRVPWLLRNLDNIQKVFGVLLILVAVAMFFNLDRKFQAYIVETFPNYGTGLTQFEQNEKISGALDQLGRGDEDMIGMPMGMGDEKDYQEAPELVGNGEWFNSEPLTIEGLNGKVVLVDFWTYSCINCIRTLPYLRNWNEKYADDGLVIIGVHTPEFEFEKDADNLAKAIEDFELKYPIVQDNDYKTWRAYNNRFWPAKYLIDREGRIRYTHFGEGSYDETENMIRELLEEAGADISGVTVSNEEYENQSSTPETYLGYNRIDNFASMEEILKDESGTYTLPEHLRKNEVAYGGEWKVEGEKALPAENAVLRINFEAKNVFLVMNPVDKSEEGEVSVYLDGGFLRRVKVDSDRLYQLVEMSEAGDHVLELRFDGKVEVFAFTFG